MMERSRTTISMCCIAIFAIALSFTLDATAQEVRANKSLREGNKLYKKENFSEAEAEYNRALEAEPTSEKGLFNQGDAYYRQEKYEEALKNFELSAEMLEDPLEKASAYHNLGNTLFKSQELEKSIEAYKDALRLNPRDEDTRYNLALAQSMLKKQQQQQDQNQDQDQQDQNQDQDQQDQQDQDQDQQDQEQQDQNQDQQQQDGDQQQEQEQSSGDQEEGEQQQQQPTPKPVQLSKEEVARILEALANDENKVQEKVIREKTKGDKVKVEKDW